MAKIGDHVGHLWIHCHGQGQRVAWQRLAHMQHVVWTQPEVAYAVWHMSLLDQLELTVELLTDGHEVEPALPLNNIPFRPRQAR